MTVTSTDPFNPLPPPSQPVAKIPPKGRTTLDTYAVPPEPETQATPKQQAKKAVIASSGKSKWYDAMNKFIKDKEREMGAFTKPYPKVHCRYLKQGEHIVSDIYTDEHNVKKIGFRVAWEVELAPGQLYSTDTTGQITKLPKVPVGTIPGIDHFPMIFTEIEDPDTKSAHVMLNCERMALGIALNLSKVIEFALNPLDSTKANDIEARNNIINYLSRHNFVGCICKNGLGKVVSARNDDDTFKEFDKIKMFPLIFGKETTAPHMKGPWTQSAKIAQRTFVQKFSEKTQFDLLSEDRKKLYSHRQYLALIMDNDQLLNPFSEELQVQKSILDLNDLALKEINDLTKDPAKNIEPESALGKWLNKNPDVAAAVATDREMGLVGQNNHRKDKAALDIYKEHLTSQLRTAKSQKETIETHFTDRFYDELTSHKQDLFIPQFASLDRKQINEFADFVQQELADTLQCYMAFLGFFDGSSPISQMTRMFDDQLRPISPRAQELASVKSDFVTRYLKYIDKELLNETMIMTPGMPKLPFLPIKPVVSLLKGLYSTLFPNAVKKVWEQNSKLKLESLEQTAKYVADPNLRGLQQPIQQKELEEIQGDQIHLISNYYDSLQVMEKLEKRMEHLKTINHAIHRRRVVLNANDPITWNAGKGMKEWFSTVTHGFFLSYPSDWDHAQFVMARRNNIARQALENIRPAGGMDEIRRREVEDQVRRSRYTKTLEQRSPEETQPLPKPKGTAATP